ncbi:hypothetical protein F5X96DRAFT_674727 [Biscogniauxia mediterranea]|nr:hypothetical protein F5X96DRAFT_674727 [Biscogniauxia mediterranea]
MSYCLTPRAENQATRRESCQPRDKTSGVGQRYDENWLSGYPDTKTVSRSEESLGRESSAMQAEESRGVPAEGGSTAPFRGQRSVEEEGASAQAQRRRGERSELFDSKPEWSSERHHNQQGPVIRGRRVHFFRGLSYGVMGKGV